MSVLHLTKGFIATLLPFLYEFYGRFAKIFVFIFTCYTSIIPPPFVLP